MSAPTIQRPSSFCQRLASLSVGFLVLAACAGSSAGKLSPEDQAKVFLDEKRPEAALPLLERAHREKPTDLEIARELVDAHVRTGQNAALIARLETEVRGQPSASGYYMLGLARYAQLQTAAGPSQQAFEQAVALAPPRSSMAGEINLRLGMALLESEKEKDALAPLERAAAIDPRRTRVRLPLAQARLRAGDREGALRELRVWLEGGPQRSEIAIARQLMGEISDPFANLPQAARGQLETGLNWLQQADVPQQAIVSFEEILHDYPDLAVIHGLLGLAYQRLDDVGRAVDEFHRAIELDPKLAQPYLYLGELYLGRQRPQQGEEALHKALERNPLLEDAWLRLGDLALERQEAAPAQEAYERLTSLVPDEPSAHGKLSSALQLRGDFLGADRELKKALELEPDSLEFTARLGLLHADRFHLAKRTDEKRSERTEAEHYLQEVLRRQPENAAASRTLESLHE